MVGRRDVLESMEASGNLYQKDQAMLATFGLVWKLPGSSFQLTLISHKQLLAPQFRNATNAPPRASTQVGWDPSLSLTGKDVLSMK